MDATTRYPHALVLLAERRGEVTQFPTGWISTNSVHYVDCPKCGAKAGYLCVTPSGRRGRDLTGGAHRERMGALRDQYPEIASLSRHINIGPEGVQA